MDRKRKRNDKAGQLAGQGSLSAPTASIDPSLNVLFTSSAGPVGGSSVVYPSLPPVKSASPTEDDVLANSDAETASSSNASGSSLLDSENRNKSADTASTSRKRRKIHEAEDLESRYLERLSRDEDENSLRKRSSRSAESSNGSDMNTLDTGINALKLVSDKKLLHESLSRGVQDPNTDNSDRTVFLGNVSSQAVTTKAARKTLLKHVSAFLPAIPSDTDPHRVDSMRFRSVAFSSGVPKRAAYAKKEVMDATTKSTNAYVVYSSKEAAQAAVRKLNGTVVLDRHLRADLVSQPSQADHKRCIFVGNLGFVDEETTGTNAENEAGKLSNPKKKRPRQPADAEEGLWRTFSTCGAVENVRVIRDTSSRVGKGFAYVQFANENAVEAALLYNDKNFPPLLPRKLRVMRARKDKKRDQPRKPNPYLAKRDRPRPKSLNGTISRLAREAGASRGNEVQKPTRKPENFVFEGHRASQTKDRLSRKTKKRKGVKPDPGSRRARRTAAFKAAGGKPKTGAKSQRNA
ncbi:MAG: hypothetical protein Q9227_004208 [Pyrenula ochraceoflavens]